MKLQQSFQLLELVLLPLAKIGTRRSVRVLLQARLQVPLFMMSKLALARVLLQVRLLNYLFTSKLLWALEQDSKNYSPQKTLTSQDHLIYSLSVSTSQRTQKLNACKCKLMFGLYHNIDMLVWMCSTQNTILVLLLYLFTVTLSSKAIIMSYSFASWCNTKPESTFISLLKVIVHGILLKQAMNMTLPFPFLYPLRLAKKYACIWTIIRNGNAVLLLSAYLLSLTDDVISLLAYPQPTFSSETKALPTCWSYKKYWVVIC